MTTGVRYSTAMRQAVTATSKQSEGEAAATTGSGDSPLRPHMACSRSPCSVLVGMPVDGPARWTSTMTSGSSIMTARLIISCFSAKPGPEVVVTPSEPPKLAPRAAPTPAISSSAWKVMTPCEACRLNSCSSSEAGVIGYEPTNSRSPARWAPTMSP